MAARKTESPSVEERGGRAKKRTHDRYAARGRRGSLEGGAGDTLRERKPASKKKNPPTGVLFAGVMVSREAARRRNDGSAMGAGKGEETAL